MSSLAYPLGTDPNQQRVPVLSPAAAADPAATSGLASPLGATAAVTPALPTPAAPLPNPPVAPGIMPTLNKPALALNPQLPQHPAALPDPGVLDSQYNAEQAQLAAEIGQRYNDVLKQLGYMDPSTGQFVMGRVESEANRQRPELYRSMDLAAEEQTRQRQAEGTLFSGRRGTEEARAQHPFVQSLADLDINVPQQLSDLYEQGGNIMSEYTNRQNLLLVDAARRRAAGLLQSAYPTAADPGAAIPGPGDLPPGVPPPTVLPAGAPLPPDQDPNIATLPTAFAARGGAYAV